MSAEPRVHMVHDLSGHLAAELGHVWSRHLSRAGAAGCSMAELMAISIAGTEANLQRALAFLAAGSATPTAAEPLMRAAIAEINAHLLEQCATILATGVEASVNAMQTAGAAR